MEITSNTNESWIALLSSDNAEERNAATEQLHGILTNHLQARFIKKGLSLDCVGDVVQETLFRVFNRLNTFRGESKFITWATAIGIRTGMELIRKQYWKTQTLGDILKEDDYDLAGPWVSSEPLPESGLSKKELLSILTKAIQSKLTEKQRKALLAEMKGMPMSEIASELGATRGSIYKLTHDARKKLKTELVDQGVELSSIIAAFEGGL